jgi:hypothetical protein
MSALIAKLKSDASQASRRGDAETVERYLHSPRHADASGRSRGVSRQALASRRIECAENGEDRDRARARLTEGRP